LGGGIDNTGYQVILTDSIVSGNQAGNGGGIENEGSLIVDHSIIGGSGTDANIASNVGGGIDADSTDSNVIIRNGSQIIGNWASGQLSGRAGGGIFGFSALTVDNSFISNNVAPAGAGGGISIDYSPTTITNSTISGNIAVEGGGIAAANPITVANTTISNNTATRSGGGFWSIADGSTTTTITNSTISGNNALAGTGGGVHDACCNTVVLTNVTIINNSTGVVSDTVLGIKLRNTLLGNTGVNCIGTLASDDYNLSSDTTCRGLTKPHDRANVNPLVGPLADNGGTTQTHALLPGSPAIDAGGTNANGCPATDQRGITRPQGMACDIGAFESYSPPPPATRPSGPPPPPAPPDPAPQPRGGIGGAGSASGPTPNPLPPSR
jgi:hypothetical protein